MLRPILNISRTSEGFSKLFKGVYIKSDYGDGTILYVDRVDLQMKYEFYVLNDTTRVPYKRKQEGFEGQDSTAYRWQTEFAYYKELFKLINSSILIKLQSLPR